MFMSNGDGTFTLGPTDVLCIFRLPTGRYHVVILEEKPIPGPIRNIRELEFIRLKSKGHHTTGARTLEVAQQHMEEMRQKLRLDDANVISDMAFEADSPICILPVRNWIRERIPVKEAIGLPTTA